MTEEEEHGQALAEEEEHGQALDDGDNKKSKEEKEGYPLWMAALFIIGQMAGSGMIILPKSLSDTGWSGVPFIVFLGTCALYAGICLSKCWVILEERYEEYRKRHRYPYVAIAYRAHGKGMQYIVSVCLEITFLGVSIVYILLSAELLAKLVTKLGLLYCYWILIAAVAMLPFMMLGSPKDLWPAAVISTLASAVSVILILVAEFLHYKSTDLNPHFSPPTFLSYFMALGTILFCFGGGATFPTFQNDMRDKKEFTTAVSLGFAALFLLYLPVAFVTYAMYGSDLTYDLTDKLPESAIKIIIFVLFIVRTMFSLLLVINASSQEFEEIFKVPDRFGWKRVVVRTGILLGCLFVALSFPRFGQILNVVGGTVVSLTCLVFPCWFYFTLCSQKQEKNWPKREIRLYEKVFLIIVILVGIFGGGITTYSALIDIITKGRFNLPCYINVTDAGKGIDWHPK